MSKEAFALQYQEAANRAGEKLGVSPQALLAQWGLETSWGKSIIPGTNNLGNIKDFSGAGVEAVDNATKSRDKYRAYPSVDAFVDDYSSLIQRRYPAAVGQKTAVGFASALKAGGYAEDPDYVKKIAQLSGEEYTVQTPAVKTAYDNAIESAVQGTILRPGNKTAWDAAIQEAQFTQDVKEAARPSTFEQIGAAIAGATDARIFGGIKEALWGPEFPDEPGYIPDLKALPVEADSELIEDYGTATSPQAAALVLSQWQDEKLRQKTVMDDGLAKGFALGVLGEAGSITNWVAPFAAAKSLQALGKGSLALAQEGRIGASFTSAVGENLISGTAVEAVAQGMEGRFNGQDLLVSLVADSLLGAAAGALGARAVGNAETLTSRAVTQAIEHEAGLAARAEAQIGTNASTGELRQVMDELERQDLNDVVKSAVAEVPAERKFVADPDVQVLAGPAETVTVRKAIAGALQSPALLTPDSTSIATRHLLTHLQNTLPTGILDDVSVSFDGGVRGAYNPVDNRISTPGSSPTALVQRNGYNEANTLGHEVVHAATGRMIAAVREGVEGISPTAVAAVKRLEGYRIALDQHLRDIGARQPSREAGADYAASDLDEFAAQVMSDVETRKALARMPAQGFKNMLSAFADAVVRLLGLDPKTNNSALKDAVALVEQIIKEGAPQGLPASTWFKTKPGLGPKPDAVVADIMTDPAIVEFGMTGVPVGTATERKQAQAMLALHKQARDWALRNPMDAAWEQRVKNLADNQVFSVASTGLVMLKSKNPLVRMVASELLEDASGAAGKRKATAAISKYMTERFMMGNTINDVQGAYAFWKKGKPGGLQDDLVGGKNWAAFNKEIAAEIEARRLANAPVSQDANVKAAVDSLEAAYQRTANAQRNAKTLGADGLPASSRGYMPHRMNPKAVFALTNEQRQILHNALTDQFITIEGWDASFSDQLASTYIKRVRDRAAGDYGSNIGGGNPGTHSLVEEALRSMDLPADTIKQHMDKFSKGAANFTKGRIELDLNRVYTTSTGDFRLLDVFETNQIELLRSQAGRASGEVALTKFGVRGKPGLKLLRDAMAYGADGKVTATREFEAFDQMAAEFLNEPFGNQSHKIMERAMAANGLVRLGGIAFNQFSESFNGIFHVGAARTLSSIASIGRLRSEIVALSKGQPVDNPFLSSIEFSGGAEFGTDAYKIAMPFDSPDHAYPTYGQDTLTLTDRLLRGGSYLQSKLSMWRMIHSAQQRGMAEQVVHKMLRYIREGKDDVALQQFGVTEQMRQALRSDLANIATFDASGRLTSLDVTKISDPNIREQTIQAVWRGTQQIIQGTFIGERGKWAHDGWLKLMTQFRTFSLVSAEKQWGRQRNSRGAAGAFGIMLGSMSIAAPIYMARTYAASVGRPDQEEYLEQRLTPEAVARATLNYVAVSGLAGDFIDLTTSVLPLGIAPTGGRAGVESDFIGNYVLPASSLVDDIWKYAQSPLNAEDAARIMPGSRMPYLIPFLNGLKD